LILEVPCGYLKLPTGEVIFDPDEQVRATVQLIFDKFAELGSFGKVYRYLARHKIYAGDRIHQGHRHATGPLALAPGRRHLVACPLGDRLSLELGKRQEPVKTSRPIDVALWKCWVTLTKAT
jgi:hypothetical protein